jgi:hypothetical protein
LRQGQGICSIRNSLLLRGDESLRRRFIFRIANKPRFVRIGKWVWVEVFLTI